MEFLEHSHFVLKLYLQSCYRSECIYLLCKAADCSQIPFAFNMNSFAVFFFLIEGRTSISRGLGEVEQ